MVDIIYNKICMVVLYFDNVLSVFPMFVNFALLINAAVAVQGEVTSVVFYHPSMMYTYLLKRCLHRSWMAVTVRQECDCTLACSEDVVLL